MSKASKAVHALEYLADSPNFPARPVCVVFGDESFLSGQVIRRLRDEVLGTEDGGFSLSSFEGATAVLADILGELSTLAMFGGERRLVLVEKADDFISRHRPELEDYVANPCSRGVLVLDVKSWPSNTRLAKAVASSGLAIDCGAPAASGLTRWVVDWARQTHRIQLARPAAEMLVEMVGTELGLLDQELAKLALTVGPGETISPEALTKMVGTWRSKTTWEMLDAALAGNVREALIQVDRLLLAGENPIAILGQISASLRRFAAATRLVLQAEASGRRTALRPVLEQAGVRSFVLKKAETQLRRLGRQRGAQLYRWLLETDLALKGESPMPPRLILENLIVRLASSPGERQ